MGDGWETKRSRGKGHFNWSIIKLGEAGYLNYAEIDTAHFLGNFPESAELLATTFDGQLPPESASWTSILPRTKLGPGRRHFFELSNVEQSYTHVMVKMHPDGGIKRVRLVGRRAGPLGALSSPLPKIPIPADVQDPLPSAASDPFAPVSDLSVVASSSSGAAKMGVVVGPRSTFVAAQPLTTQAFAPYGSVIANPPAEDKAPFKIVNQGTARKYVSLAPVASTYPVEADAKTNIHIYHCDPVASSAMPFRVKLLERHRFTTQAFLPMTPHGKGQDGYLVVVALNGAGEHCGPRQAGLGHGTDLALESCFQTALLKNRL